MACELKHEGLYVAGGVFMPQDSETNLTQGFAFVEYNTPQVSLDWKLPLPFEIDLTSVHIFSLIRIEGTQTE